MKVNLDLGLETVNPVSLISVSVFSEGYIPFPELFSLTLGES